MPRGTRVQEIHHKEEAPKGSNVLGENVFIAILDIAIVGQRPRNIHCVSPTPSQQTRSLESTRLRKPQYNANMKIGILQ